MITALFPFSMELDSWVQEQAREELKTLEAQYPDRFDYLKLELRAFISHPGNLSPFLGSTRKEDDDDDEEEEEKRVSGLSTSVCTQESSNRKRSGTANRGTAPNPKKPKNRPSTRYKDTVDIAIEKAEACLRKIREMKQSFL